MKSFYVYIMGSRSGVLYIGVTSNLERRVYQHKNGLIEGFTKKYKCHKLLHYEMTNDPEVAISREKQLKKWRREKKELLIRRLNPNYSDLSASLEMTE